MILLRIIFGLFCIFIMYVIHINIASKRLGQHLGSTSHEKNLWSHLLQIPENWRKNFKNKFDRSTFCTSVQIKELVFFCFLSRGSNYSWSLSRIIKWDSYYCQNKLVSNDRFWTDVFIFLVWTNPKTIMCTFLFDFVKTSLLKEVRRFLRFVMMLFECLDICTTS